VYAQKVKNDGTTAWANPVQLTSAVVLNVHETSFVNDGNDGILCSYSGSLTSPSGSEVIVQYIQPDGSLPWGATGKKFSTTTNMLEFDNVIRFDPVAVKIWVAAVRTNSSQSTSGLYLQAFDISGNRLLGNDAKEILAQSTDLYRFMGMNLMADLPTVVYTDNVSHHLNAIQTKTDGNPAWPAPLVLNDRPEPKNRPGLGDYYAGAYGELVFVWVDTRGGSNGIYAQNIKTDGSIGPLEATSEALPDQFKLQILPNPATSTTVHLQFETVESEPLKLEVFDLTGVLARRDMIPVTGTSQSVTLDISGLHAGNWLIKFSNRKGVSIGKLSVVK
jgi:hypothetical protein